MAKKSASPEPLIATLVDADDARLRLRLWVHRPGQRRNELVELAATEFALDQLADAIGRVRDNLALKQDAEGF
jgi:hypothetical protein